MSVHIWLVQVQILLKKTAVHIQYEILNFSDNKEFIVERERDVSFCFVFLSSKKIDVNGNQVDSARKNKILFKISFNRTSIT